MGIDYAHAVCMFRHLWLTTCHTCAISATRTIIQTCTIPTQDTLSAYYVKRLESLHKSRTPLFTFLIEACLLPGLSALQIKFKHSVFQ